MAEWLGHSNQKLYQARLLLDYQEQFEAESPIDSVLNAALQESILFQLALAYQSYLHEVAELAQYREEFGSLQQLLDLAPIQTGEMIELRKLELDTHSWLSQMLLAFEFCGQKENKPEPRRESASMIQLYDQTSAALPLRDWYQSLSDIIDLQRNNRQEC